MTNKTTTSFLFFWIIFSLLSSCKNRVVEDLTTNETSKISLSNDHILSEEDVIESCIEFFTEDSNIRTHSKDELKVKDVNHMYINIGNDSLRSASVENEPILVYAVNFEDNKSMIVSGDKRLPITFAILDHSNFYFNDKNNETKGVINFISEVLKTNINEIKKNNNRYLSTTTRSNIMVEWEWSKKEFVYPKLKVEWSQQYPFNKNVEYRPNPDIDIPVGCVPIAIAQALTFIKPDVLSLETWKSFEEKEYNASKIIQNGGPSEELSSFIALMCYVSNVKLSPDGSSAHTEKALNNATREFGINIKKIKLREIKDVLKKEGSVIVVRGNDKMKDWFFFKTYKDGHAFVIDGYKQRNNKKSYGREDFIGLTSETLCHINFGWGPGYNGYYWIQGSFRDREWTADHIPEPDDDEEPYPRHYYRYYESIFTYSTKDKHSYIHNVEAWEVTK